MLEGMFELKIKTRELVKYCEINYKEPRCPPHHVWVTRLTNSFQKMTKRYPIEFELIEDVMSVPSFGDTDSTDILLFPVLR